MARISTGGTLKQLDGVRSAGGVRVEIAQGKLRAASSGAVLARQSHAVVVTPSHAATEELDVVRRRTRRAAEIALLQIGRGDFASGVEADHVVASGRLVAAIEQMTHRWGGRTLMALVRRLVRLVVHAIATRTVGVRRACRGRARGVGGRRRHNKRGNEHRDRDHEEWVELQRGCNRVK